MLAVEVRPRAYASSPSQVGAAVSEAPVDSVVLDSIAALATAAAPFASTTVVYFVRSPIGGYDARATVDPAGDLIVPVELLDGSPRGERVVFHGLMAKAIRQHLDAADAEGGVSEVREAYRALVRGATPGSTEPGNDAMGALWPGTYPESALSLRVRVDDVAASALTVLRYHHDALTARLDDLAPANRLVVEPFLAAVVGALAGPERVADLELLIPGAMSLAASTSR